VRRLTTPDGRRDLLERARRSYESFRTAVLSGAAGASVGARLRGAVDRRSASRAFRGTPCSTLPPAGRPDDADQSRRMDADADVNAGTGGGGGRGEPRAAADDAVRRAVPRDAARQAAPAKEHDGERDA